MSENSPQFLRMVHLVTDRVVQLVAPFLDEVTEATTARQVQPISTHMGDIISNVRALRAADEHRNEVIQQLRATISHQGEQLETLQQQVNALQGRVEDLETTVITRLQDDQPDPTPPPRQDDDNDNDNDDDDKHDDIPPDHQDESPFDVQDPEYRAVFCGSTPLTGESAERDPTPLEYADHVDANEEDEGITNADEAQETVAPTAVPSDGHLGGEPPPLPHLTPFGIPHQAMALTGRAQSLPIPMERPFRDVVSGAARILPIPTDPHGVPPRRRLPQFPQVPS